MFNLMQASSLNQISFLNQIIIFELFKTLLISYLNIYTFKFERIKKLYIHLFKFSIFPMIF